MKTYGAEMKAVATQTDGFTSAEDKAKAKAATLEQSIAAQKEKVALLSKAVKESADKYGEHDQRTEKWKQALANAQTQLNGMESQLEDCTDEVKKSGDEVEKGSSKWEGFGEIVKAAGVAIGAAVTAAAAAAVELGKSVVNAYAEYEQLTGGVETLFEKSSGLVEKYAANAYKTAGLSANEYMQTVTGFSASLISSLGGDTTAAAVYADQAIKDMSDNANKFGSDMETVSNAYAGFSKGQFQLLDNLKLGYGGTKTEMERLIADANALKEANGEMGDLTIDSYADIVTAIHIVQTEMGITGTTAKEAEQTISGSIEMTKGAYENLLTALGTGEGVEEAVSNLVESAANVLANVTPVIERMVSVLPDVFSALADAAMELLPELADTAMDLLSQVLESLVESAPVLAETLSGVLSAVISMITENLDSILQSVIMLAETLITALIEALPTVLSGLSAALPVLIESAISLVKAVGQGIIDNLDSIVAAALELIMTLVDTILEALPELIEMGTTMLISLIDGILDNLPMIIETVGDLIVTLIEAIVDNLPLIIESGMELMESLIDGILDNLPIILPAIIKVILAIVEAIVMNLPKIIESGIEIIVKLVFGLIEAIPKIVEAIPQIIKAIVETFKEHDWGSIGRNIMEGLKDGLLNAWDTVKRAVTNVCDKISDTFCGWFGIESPSKWMRDQIGGNLMAGLEVGLERYSDGALKTAGKISEEIGDAFKVDYSPLTMGGRSMDLTLTTPVYLDGRVIANVVNEQLGVLI